MIKFRLEPEAHQCRLEQLRVHAKHDKRNSRLICTKRTGYFSYWQKVRYFQQFVQANSRRPRLISVTPQKLVKLLSLLKKIVGLGGTSRKIMNGNNYCWGIQAQTFKPQNWCQNWEFMDYCRIPHGGVWIMIGFDVLEGFVFSRGEYSF